MSLALVSSHYLVLNKSQGSKKIACYSVEIVNSANLENRNSVCKPVLERQDNQSIVTKGNKSIMSGQRLVSIPLLKSLEKFQKD